MTNEELVKLIKAGINEKENMGRLYSQNKGYLYKVCKPYARICDLEELVQEAYFGIYEAVQKYDEDSGVKFLTYASFCIKRVLNSYALSNSHTLMIPSYLVSLMSKYNRFTASYSGSQPTKDEYIQHLGITESRYENLIKVMAESNCVSMDQDIFGTDGLTNADMIADEFRIEDRVVGDEVIEQLQADVWNCVDKLNTKYRNTIIKRYKGDMSPYEVAKEYRCGVKQIVKLETKALIYLRKDKKIQELGSLLNINGNVAK